MESQDKEIRMTTRRRLASRAAAVDLPFALAALTLAVSTNNDRWQALYPVEHGCNPVVD
jgi:hypothetical protein